MRTRPNTLPAALIAAALAIAASPLHALTVSGLSAELEQRTRIGEAGEGHWLVAFRGEKLLVFAHPGHDRMRVVTPVAGATDLTESDLRILLEANYDRALDAKYSISEGQVWAIFAHPLASLQKEELASALEQVVALKKNYGSTYASTDKFFARREPSQ